RGRRYLLECFYTGNRLAGRRHPCSRHINRPLLLPTGLADGLAPKRRRYARTRFAPKLVPPLPSARRHSSGAGIQLYGRGILTTTADGVAPAAGQCSTSYLGRRRYSLPATFA